MIGKRLLYAVITTLVLTATAALADRPEPEVYGEFDGDPMYTLLEPNGIPAIMAPEYLTGAAAADQMSPQEPVMGLTEGKDSVCWSTWQLDRHEIVNDEFGGRPIAASW